MQDPAIQKEHQAAQLQKALERGLPIRLLGLRLRRDRARIQLLETTGMLQAELVNGTYLLGAQRFWVQLMADGAKTMQAAAGGEA